VIKIAIDDGISIAEVLERGAYDLKLRVAYAELARKKESDGRY